MGKETGIQWTDHTFNIVWGCQKVSPACANCYAERDSKRYGFNVWGGKDTQRRTLGEHHWNDPRRWDLAAKKDGVKRKVFCSSMADVFEDHPTVDAEREKLWPLIRATPNLIWQLLTKRPERIVKCLPEDWQNLDCFYTNVWFGSTVENNDYVGRADHLRAVPCDVRFVSYEPCLGPIDKLDLTGIHWLIAGGESGPNFRQHDPRWVIQARDMCKAAGVAFFYKQDSGFRPSKTALVEGKEYHEFPS